MMANARTAMDQLDPAVFALGQRFADAGFELALVGGPVRDALLGRPSVDIDLTTNARPEQTEEILAGWAATTWDMGREFGTIGARHGDLTVEITTYRSDRYDLASRKPEVAFGDTIEGDLSRRDFTVNAMAMRLPDLQLIDPFNGLDDLVAGMITTPVGAEQSFSDDPLRIMRAARFSAQLNFDVDESVFTAMSAQAERLSIVSAERICAELTRLLLADHPRRGLELMTYTGVAEVVLPELSALQDTVDEHKRHKDVYEHTLTVLDRAIALEDGPDGPVPAPDLVLRLAAIMHDVGKPKTRRFEGGKVTFHQHDVVGARMTRKRLTALRFDKATVKAVSRLVELHLRAYGYSEGAWTDSAVRRYVSDAGELLDRLNKLTRADCTTRNRRKALILQAGHDDLEERIAELKKAEDLAAIRPDLNGEQIMELLDLRPGPQVGKAYKYLLGLRMERGPLGGDAARQELLTWWEQQQG